MILYEKPWCCLVFSQVSVWNQELVYYCGTGLSRSSTLLAPTLVGIPIPYPVHHSQSHYIYQRDLPELSKLRHAQILMECWISRFELTGDRFASGVVICRQWTVIHSRSTQWYLIFILIFFYWERCTTCNVMLFITLLLYKMGYEFTISLPTVRTITY